jgi:cytochrome c553
MPKQHRSRQTPIRALAFLLAFGAAVAGMHPDALAADAAAGKATAKKCQACHGIDGVSKQAHVPHIAGESDIYLIKQLKAFRSGERQDPQMSVMAKPLSDEDIANLAAWYSSIKITVTLPE